MPPKKETTLLNWRWNNSKKRYIQLFFRKTLRAVIVLFVFLGFTHVVFLYNPKDGGTGEICYLLVNAISQGGQVSISYRDFGSLIKAPF